MIYDIAHARGEGECRLWSGCGAVDFVQEARIRVSELEKDPFDPKLSTDRCSNPQLVTPKISARNRVL